MKAELALLLGFALITLALSHPLLATKALRGQLERHDAWQALDGRSIDLMTQRGGRGSSEQSPPYTLGEEVILFAIATYNGFPEQAKDVAFRVMDPLENLFILYEKTDSAGIARVSFRLPSEENSEKRGIWKVEASVNIAEVVVEDFLDFHVKWNLADIDNDLKVDIYDVVSMCSAFNKTPHDPEWNLNCDIAEPYEIVDIHDVSVICGSYGEQ